MSPHRDGERGRPLRRWQKAVLGLGTALLLLVGLEGLLALCGVRPAAEQADPFVGFEGTLPLFERAGEATLRTAPGKLRLFNPQSFPVAKPAGGYRIFCLGGSTTYGRPYDDRTAFSGWLRALLPVADPGRKWEVVNAGGISYASYRLVVLMKELAHYGPDLFLVYTGHNEFLERRTYKRILDTPSFLRRIAAELNRSRIYSLLKRVLKGKVAAPRKPENLLPAEVRTILDRSVGPSWYERDDALADRIAVDFRANLLRMVDLARAAGARIVFITPASNLRDCRPFKSRHRDGLSRAELARWEELWGKVREGEDSGDLRSALSAAGEALRLDDRYAELHYLRGRILFRLGRRAEAAKAFRRARDEDICPLRAPTRLQEAVREVAKQREVPCVDFARFVEARSEGGIAGKDWFLDHVHPTIEAHRRLALELIDTLERLGIVEKGATWTEQAIARVTRDVEGRIDDAARARALRNLSKVMVWAGRLEESQQLAARAAKLSADDPGTYYQLGLNAYLRGEYKEATRQYGKALALRPTSVEALVGLANVRIAEGDYGGAVPLLRRALAKDERRAVAHNSLGFALALLGRTREAFASYRRALELESDYGNAHANLALLLAREGRLEEALPHWRRILELEPRNAVAHNDLGYALAQLGRFDEAVPLYEKAIACDPHLLAAHMNLAWLLATCRVEKIRDGKRALLHAERACELAGDRNLRALQGLAASLAEVGRFKEALETARRAFRIAGETHAPATLRRAIELQIRSYAAGRPYRQ